MNLPFTLRAWQKQDLDDLLAYANNYQIAKNLTNQFPYPYTREHGISFIEQVSNGDPLRVFAIAVDDKAVGAIGIHPQSDIYCKNAELGYWLAEPFWGKGIITSAIEQIVEYGFKNFAITRIFARPFGSNIGSQKALEKAGFVLEAKLKATFFKAGQFEDEYIYAIYRPLETTT